MNNLDFDSDIFRLKFSMVISYFLDFSLSKDAPAIYNIDELSGRIGVNLEDITPFLIKTKILINLDQYKKVKNVALSRMEIEECKIEKDDNKRYFISPFIYDILEPIKSRLWGMNTIDKSLYILDHIFNILHYQGAEKFIEYIKHFNYSAFNDAIEEVIITFFDNKINKNKKIIEEFAVITDDIEIYEKIVEYIYKIMIIDIEQLENVLELDINWINIFYELIKILEDKKKEELAKIIKRLSKKLPKKEQDKIKESLRSKYMRKLTPQTEEELKELKESFKEIEDLSNKKSEILNYYKILLIKFIYDYRKK